MNTTADIPDLLARGFRRAPTSYQEDCLDEAFRAAGAFVGRGPFRHARIVREEVQEGRDVKEATARLIAAAPSMLETLEAVAARWDKYDEEDAPELGASIRAVIAAVRGEVSP